MRLTPDDESDIFISGKIFFVEIFSIEIGSVDIS